MNSQHLLSWGISATTTLTMILISSKSAVASDPIFHCQLNQATPTTIAKTSSGKDQPVFHWKLDTANISTSPEDLCNTVTQKLNNYISEGNDLSSLTFKASTVFQENEEVSPAICIAGEDEPCELPLFTLQSSDNPKVAHHALDVILDPALQTTPIKSGDRGFQSTSYKVNLWDLLGF